MAGAQVSLDVRVAELEARVRALEAALASGASGASPRTLTPYRGDGTAPSAPPAAPRPDVETALGLRWFNRLGAVVVLVGLVLGAGWASERGWLGEEARAVLAGLAALVALRAGLGQLAAPERGRRTFGLGVAVVGGLGMDVVLLAAAHIDRVIPAGAAAVGGAAWSVALGALAWRRREAGLLHLAVAAGLAVPVLAWSGGASFGPLVAWLAALTGGVLALAWRWPGLAGAGVGLAPGAALYLVVALGAGAPGGVALAARAAAATLVLGAFAGALALAVRAGRPAARVDRLAAAAGIGGAVLVWLVVADAGHERLAAGALALGAFGLGAGALALRPREATGAAAGTLFALAVGLAALAPAVAEVSVVRLATAWAGLGAATVVLAARAGLARSAWLGLALVAGAGLAAAERADARTLPLGEVVAWLAAAGAAALAARVAADRRARAAALLLAHGLALALALRLAWVVAGGGASFRWWSSAALVGYGLAGLAAGLAAARARPATRRIGLALLVVAAAKVLVVDVWALPDGLRVAAFLTLGAGLLTASFLYGRQLDRRRARGRAG